MIVKLYIMFYICNQLLYSTLNPQDIHWKHSLGHMLRIDKKNKFQMSAA